MPRRPAPTVEDRSRTVGHPPQSQDGRGHARPPALGPHPVLVQGPVRWPQANQCQVRDRAGPAHVPGCLPQAALHRAGGRVLRVEGHQGAEGKAALCHRHAPHSVSAASGRTGKNLRPASGCARSQSSPPTTNALVADIHDRMPLILATDDYTRWLGEEPDPRDLMRPFPAEPMRMWPISTRVNKPENDDPSIVEPVEFATDAA